MGFIEKMLGVRDSGVEAAAPADAATQEPTPTDTATTEQETSSGDNTAAQPEKDSYTPDEVTQLLETKKQEWLDEQKELEAERLRQLPESERIKREQITKDDEIASLKAQLSQQELQKEVVAKLDEQRLPVSIAELVQYGDKESTMVSLDKITKVFNTAVLEGVNNRLRGKTPEGLGGAANRENMMKDPFAGAFLNALK